MLKLDPYEANYATNYMYRLMQINYKALITLNNQNNVLFIDVSRSECQGDWWESDKSGRHIRKAIWIGKTDNMNRDEGSYQLRHIWDKLLHTNDRYRKSVLMKTSDMKSKRR